MSEVQKKLVIAGKAPASLPLVPYGDEYEIWSLSDNYRQLKRWDRWFELHDIEFHRGMNPDHWGFLTTDHGKPLYLLEPHSDIPHATVFPKNEIFKRFPQPQYHRYFTNSVSWFIALAIVEGFKHIELYGVDMAQHEEYAHQRPSCEYWIGIANGLGVSVYIPAESDLMKCNKLYGYETHSGDMYRKCRARDFELIDRIKNLEHNRSDAELQKHMVFGALQELRKNFAGISGEQLAQMNGQFSSWVANRCMELDAKLQGFTQVADNCKEQILVLEGARQNMAWTRQWCD